MIPAHTHPLPVSHQGEYNARLLEKAADIVRQRSVLEHVMSIEDAIECAKREPISMPVPAKIMNDI